MLILSFINQLDSSKRFLAFTFCSFFIKLVPVDYICRDVLKHLSEPC